MHAFLWTKMREREENNEQNVSSGRDVSFWSSICLYAPEPHPAPAILTYSPSEWGCMFGQSLSDPVSLSFPSPSSSPEVYIRRHNIVQNHYFLVSQKASFAGAVRFYPQAEKMGSCLKSVRVLCAVIFHFREKWLYCRLAVMSRSHLVSLVTDKACDCLDGYCKQRNWIYHHYTIKFWFMCRVLLCSAHARYSDGEALQEQTGPYRPLIVY